VLGTSPRREALYGFSVPVEDCRFQLIWILHACHAQPESVINDATLTRTVPIPASAPMARLARMPVTGGGAGRLPGAKNGANGDTQRGVAPVSMCHAPARFTVS
jgi:hypothetical protein